MPSLIPRATAPRFGGILYFGSVGCCHVPTCWDVSCETARHSLHPSVVVVNGTRIISRPLLDALDCPIINTHAGITPRFRGVHGGYWALVQGTPELVGTTVHLVDQGIDTGGVLAQATFEPTRADTVATYPYLHLAAGLPLLADQLARLREVGDLTPVPASGLPDESRLYLHPTSGSTSVTGWRTGYVETSMLETIADRCGGSHLASCSHPS